MIQSQPAVLVTGGAGYIGSHVVKALQTKGYSVIILDSLVYGHRDIVEQVLQAELVVGDICDRALLDHLFATREIVAVMHFAAYAYVGESVTNPAKYYRNNVAGTLTLLEAMVAASVKKLVFSSTCATYGIPKQVPIPETHPQAPINPYGTSKLIVEQMLADFDAAYGLKSVCFRYFNAAGADPEGQLGEDHSPEPHLIPLVLLTALGQRDSISIFGDRYPTPDGTCIRDYIHVCDLADAHLLGLEYLLEQDTSQTFNLSNGSGFSVRAVIDTVQRVTQRELTVQICPARAGDPPILVGSCDRAREILGWQPQFPQLETMLHHAWAWHQKRHKSHVNGPRRKLEKTSHRELVSASAAGRH
ncbi:UDP-glucose 4-epimerase GalE [Romeria aff. gracilis LEGE 07310]|uniref:UDP-glucose 4-epimerase n=1 Tax=Vasconcelosia minhoensis LEGE 07310 TaxID=915328 RepID=A0A8J7AG67_9CYAN|nr:UDP-glucose 4-epimerase GalE [Romeria gracilis]MBE9076933.1 UDP-glucose 4-epimerase GalE [Romeria aff. gracilis LEGE 07310]